MRFLCSTKTITAYKCRITVRISKWRNGKNTYCTKHSFIIKTFLACEKQTSFVMLTSGSHSPPSSVQVLFVNVLCLMDMFLCSRLQWKRIENILGLQASCRAIPAGLDTAAAAGLPAVVSQPTRTSALSLTHKTFHHKLLFNVRHHFTTKCYLMPGISALCKIVFF